VPNRPGYLPVAAVHWQCTAKGRQSHTVWAQGGPGTLVNRLYDSVIMWALECCSNCCTHHRTLFTTKYGRSYNMLKNKEN